MVNPQLLHVTELTADCRVQFFFLGGSSETGSSATHGTSLAAHICTRCVWAELGLAAAAVTSSPPSTTGCSAGCADLAAFLPPEGAAAVEGLAACGRISRRANSEGAEISLIYRASPGRSPPMQTRRRRRSQTCSYCAEEGCTQAGRHQIKKIRYQNTSSCCRRLHTSGLSVWYATKVCAESGMAMPTDDVSEKTADR